MAEHLLPVLPEAASIKVNNVLHVTTSACTSLQTSRDVPGLSPKFVGFDSHRSKCQAMEAMMLWYQLSGQRTVSAASVF